MADTGTGSDRRELSISESRTCGKTSGGGCDSAGRNVSLLDQSGSICKCRMNLATSKENVEIGVNALIANLVRK